LENASVAQEFVIHVSDEGRNTIAAEEDIEEELATCLDISNSSLKS
jgi:hypothetical protein